MGMFSIANDKHSAYTSVTLLEYNRPYQTGSLIAQVYGNKWNSIT